MKEIRRKVFRFLPRKVYLELLYKRLFGKKPNLENPKLFTEKLFWLKRYYELNMSELLNELHDKYTARDYIKREIGDAHLSKIYGVYDRVDDIDFDILPKAFMLKLTKMSGRNIPCMDINALNKDNVRKQFKEWLDEPAKVAKVSEEGYMLKGKTRILCEESLFTKQGTTPLEYTVHCFNGTAKFIAVDDILNDEVGNITGVIRNLYDLDWNLMPVDFGRKRNEQYRVDRPDNFDELIRIAEKLSKPFPYVRVDLYDIEGHIIFRELTWIPMGGNIKIKPSKYDELFGEWLKLPNVKVF